MNDLTFNLLDSSVIKALLSVREVLRSNTGSVTSDTVWPTARHRCVVSSIYVQQALSRDDGPRHSLHASAQSRNFDLLLQIVEGTSPLRKTQS